MPWPAYLLLCFFVGAIPFGVIVTRAKGIDIRKVGSGNIGATNVIRAVGKPLGFMVFVLDVLKGLAPALCAGMVGAPSFVGHGQEWAFIAGFAAVLGHMFSPFLGFRGGKGVATGLGVMFGTTPIVAALVFGIFILLLATTRYVSLSSMVAASSMPFLGFALGDPPSLLIAYTVLAIVVVIRHRDNIRNLRQGTERKFGSS